MKKIIFWIFAGLLSFMISLVVLAPLHLITNQLSKVEPQWQFNGVHGTLWRGEIQDIRHSQIHGKNFNWSFKPGKLFALWFAADIKGIANDIDLKGVCGIKWNQSWHCEPLILRADSQGLNQLIPQGQPWEVAGDAVGKFDSANWLQDELPQINGELTWVNGAIIKPVSLALGGRYQVQLATDADNTLNAEVSSSESALAVSGNATMQPDTNYKGLLLLNPAPNADPSISAALDLAIGDTKQSNGEYKLPLDGKLFDLPENNKP